MSEDTRTETIPVCIGIILDGNRRWAKENNLPSLEGHRRGSDRLTDASRWTRDRGIKNLVVYVFSTENWRRTEEEIGYLMDLIQEGAVKALKSLTEEGIRIRVIGKTDMLPDDPRAALATLETASKENDQMTLWLCISYGSRAEIVAAAQATAKAGEEITEESLHSHLWSAEMPDPDIIIRTGGEMRISNFLLWQAAYSELFFVKPYWPDFSEAELDRVLVEYSERSRRHGR